MYQLEIFEENEIISGILKSILKKSWTWVG